MDKKEAFKEFLRAHPKITEYLKNNKDSSIQKLYEIYDIYGEDSTAWSPYLDFTSKTSNSSRNESIGSIKDLMKNIDVDSLQEHIKTAQKALGFIEELTSKGASNVGSIPKGPKSPRPLDKFFGDW